MNVAVCRTRQYGPSVLFTLPPGSEAPAEAHIPHLAEGVLQHARSQWAAKGTAVNWEDWAQALAGQLPYFEQWAVEQVPDGLTATEALSYVRRQESERLMDGQT